MTRLEIRHDIEQLDAKMHRAIGAGNSQKVSECLAKMEELEEDLGVMPHEFGGE